jgi:hypothetical protein
MCIPKSCCFSVLNYELIVVVVTTFFVAAGVVDFESAHVVVVVAAVGDTIVDLQLLFN